VAKKKAIKKTAKLPKRASTAESSIASRYLQQIVSRDTAAFYRAYGISEPAKKESPKKQAA
jgi:hypothetical protein